MAIKCSGCEASMPKYFFLVDSNKCRLCQLENPELVTENKELKEKVKSMEATIRDLLEKVAFLEEVNTKKKETNTPAIWSSPKKTVKNKVEKNCVLEIKNRFDVLELDEEIEVCVIGDSQIRNLGIELNSRRNNNKKKSKKNFITFCHPGATTDQLCNRLDETQNDPKKDFVIHVGGNDIREKNGKFRRSEDIIENYKLMIEKCKAKSRNTFITSILPRPTENIEWYSRALGINDRIREMCDKPNLIFIDLWDSFYNNNTLYASNGNSIHINNLGLNKLAEIVYENFTNPSQDQTGQ